MDATHGHRRALVCSASRCTQCLTASTKRRIVLCPPTLATEPIREARPSIRPPFIVKVVRLRKKRVWQCRIGQHAEACGLCLSHGAHVGATLGTRGCQCHHAKGRLGIRCARRLRPDLTPTLDQLALLAAIAYV